MVQEYSPKVVGFLCQWCSYAGADLAGAMRLQYPPNIRIIQVPCTGKIDILHLLQAFEVGADTVFISGCHEGDCHYMAGNYYARKRVERAKEILKEVGLEPERLEMFHVSASEGPKFAAVAREMTERAYRLGPNPVKRKVRSAWLAQVSAAEVAA
ncbi:MAG: hydrogenase iron-sulfur subunit [Proteobacteria bacterium]|nr:hydrogenase iron-sulfur subunit [Pseudomonadota bacterium]MBU4357305.1 hydrogenase iron-sulfur subunit [Pseudomonadota bacterium]